MSDRIAFGLSLALLFVWSLPGTVALRMALLLAALALLARRLASAGFQLGVRASALPLVLLATLTFWLLLQAVFVSADTAWALGELRGQWLPALLALTLGFLLAYRVDARHLVTAVALVFAAQAAIAVGHSLWHWFAHGQLLVQLVPLTGGKLEMSFVLNILLAILTVDVFCRASGRDALLRLPLAAVAAMVLLALAGSLLAAARNGIIGIAFLAVLALSLFVFDQRRHLGRTRTLAASMAIVAGLAVAATVNFRTDSRWQAFTETAAIAWDIDRYSAWFAPSQHPWPKLADGRNVDHSTYTRIAFVRGGLRLIAEEPLGHGYGRNAFAHALRQRHPEAQLGHAHNGWVDLGVGGGVPALALWAAFLGGLMWRGWRAFFASDNPHGLLLFFLATGYAGRMVLDSVNKDHMLQIFMFLAGLLLMLTTPRREEAGP
ncbi:O-antigen ligase family protein [Sulfurisoma sediminicola]|uniref:O-antigen ligase n=1 Tax=Sulfurisoma sediminicola TaxID=1381557 RepID=A0A497XK40_9PROT|nr:O-antigen ligase family protein [Sulfurisoma sediminicola]RLJ68313.1 O-antigen ligase [Sulfurisoma sediminicola]